MADLIPFPRLAGDNVPRDSQNMAHWVHFGVRLANAKWPERGCANGMPGHPPCRSPNELEAMLRQHIAQENNQ